MAEAPSDLNMVPLTQADAHQADDGPGKSATAFFALPSPKRKEPEPEPTPPPVSGPPPGGPPGGMPPMMGGMPPGMSMGGMGSMSGMGIQGPVAGGAMGGQPSGYGMGVPPIPPPDGDIDRARSYRVFAVVAGLMFMVCTALILMAGLTVAAMSMKDTTPPPSPTNVAAAPSPRPRAVVDTGVKGPAPKPTPKPRPSGQPRPASPSPAPAAPAPAPAPPAGPASATIKIGPSEPFTGIEVTCPISGFRERGTFVGGAATITGVPQEECTVRFKGGPPASNVIKGGQTKTCEFPQGQAVCN